MKKLNFLADEILNREDLRQVVGGQVALDGECSGRTEKECPYHTIPCNAGGKPGKWVGSQ